MPWKALIYLPGISRTLLCFDTALQIRDKTEIGFDEQEGRQSGRSIFMEVRIFLQYGQQMRFLITGSQAPSGNRRRILL